MEHFKDGSFNEEGPIVKSLYSHDKAVQTTLDESLIQPGYRTVGVQANPQELEVEVVVPGRRGLLSDAKSNDTGNMVPPGNISEGSSNLDVLGKRKRLQEVDEKENIGFVDAEMGREVGGKRLRPSTRRRL